MLSDMSTTTILLIVVVVIALWSAFAYNRFVTLVNQAKEAWADIQVQLKRRYELIPNLLQAVKGYAAHESSAFENVTKARAAAIEATNSTPAAQAEAENQLSGALKSLFAISEAYPDLKANENFLKLQQELSDTENLIQAARRFYNGAVRDLNTALASFPNNIVASFLRFEPREFFELTEADGAASQSVPVTF
jgi:LemA protein